MSVEDTEVIHEFLIESHENLDQLDRDFVALESDPGARDRITTIFRTIHTIKGTCGFLGFTKLETLTHAGETLLSQLRDGELTLTNEITSALLAMVDCIRQTLKCIEATAEEGAADYGALPETLHGFRGEPAPAPAIAPQAAPVPAVATPAAPEPAEPAAIAATDSSVRVDVRLLDRLMNLVGELVLARNRILQVGSQRNDAALIEASQRLNQITTELQDGVMKTRMQPIENVWNKFPRIVRDLALECGKQIRLELVGKETDLDRTIIEAIKDPMTHLVRNSVDHGIERPEARERCGKSATGKLLLRAFHAGGQVNIEISDDGAGIDPDKIRQKAIERGLITAERASRMKDREILNLIFLPGFSTAERVTNVSGRGVGMDVVKTNIERIGGTIDVQSRAGHGTTMKIRIPLTLAIVPALIVTCRRERFAIPQVNLLELVRLDRASVEEIHGTPVYRLRGRLLPLVFLHAAIGLGGAAPDASAPLNLVVLQADDRQFGLVVDTVCDTQEIVVKPLGKELRNLPAFAGATIMGDGRVALILDVLGIAQRANVVSEAQDRGLGRDRVEAPGAVEDKQALLLFHTHGDARMAMPLSMVARLEEFGHDRVEWIGNQRVIQYRNEILPLIDLTEHVDGRAPRRGPLDGPLQVVVYSERGQSVGLIVERILDIVEEVLAVRRRTVRRGVIGAAVIQGKVTDLLDVHGVIVAEDPRFFDRTDAA